MTTTDIPISATALMLAVAPRAGRRRRLEDPAVQANILAAIEAGSYLKPACRLAGVAASTFFEWRRRAEAGDPSAADLLPLFDGVRQRDALAECQALAVVRRGGPDWVAAAWFLSRRFPSRWGRPSVRRRRAAMLEEMPDLESLTDRELEEMAEELKMRAG